MLGPYFLVSSYPHLGSMFVYGSVILNILLYTRYRKAQLLAEELELELSIVKLIKKADEIVKDLEDQNGSDFL